MLCNWLRSGGSSDQHTVARLVRRWMDWHDRGTTSTTRPRTITSHKTSVWEQLAWTTASTGSVDHGSHPSPLSQRSRVSCGVRHSSWVVCRCQSTPLEQGIDGWLRSCHPIFTTHTPTTQHTPSHHTERLPWVVCEPPHGSHG